MLCYLFFPDGQKSQMLFAASVASLLVSLFFAPAIHAQLHLADRLVPEATLTEVSSSGWSFTLSDQPKLTSDRVVRLGSWGGLTRQQAVWLGDGSWLAGELSMGAEQLLTIDGDWLQLPKIPLNVVRGLVINPPASLNDWIQLQEQMQAAEGSQDVVWLLNKQRVSGVIRWSRDGQELELEGTNKQSVKVAWNDIQAIVLSPTLLGPVPAMYQHQLGLADGTLLSYATLDTTAGTPAFVLPSGLKVEALEPLRDWLAAVRYIAGRPDKVEFLSDKQPASYRQASDNQMIWELGVDRDCYGRPLIHQAGIVAKGLAMHGPAQVAYRCDAAGGRFLAQVVMAEPDPQTTINFGHVVCRVLLARGGQLDEVSKFELSRTNDGLQQQLLDIDLAGAQLLVLLVEKGEFGSVGDHVLWLDARIATP